jgi:ABC-2 type transport system ATP-binding protein
MNDVIVTEKLTKHYKDVTAVSDLSINVRKGEIYGFLGLNGAGKTTTIRILLGMIKTDSGNAYIKGEKVNSNNTAMWSKIGYLVEVPYSYPNLTVRENLEIIRHMRAIASRTCIDEIIEKLKLQPYANRLAKNLSLGNAQRLGLAKALIHKPEILILDEPSNGLDPAGIYEIRELLMDLAVNQGVTVFISSHILGEVAKLATRIGIIHEGKLIQEVDTSALEKLCQKKLQINTANPKAAKAFLAQNGYLFTSTDDGILESLNPELVMHPENASTMLVTGGYPPTMLMVKEEDLETYFLRIIGINGGVL